MLKKLVKFGNSNALILDRSILALLDIKEGSVLKLRIEGDALIVKAEKNSNPTDLLMAEVEGLDERMNISSPVMEILKKNTLDLCSKVENKEVSMELLKQWVPGSENVEKMKEAFGKIMQKYQKDLEPLGTQACINEFQALNNKYKEEKNSEKYLNEVMALRLKFCPKIAEMDKEMKEDKAWLSSIIKE